MDVEAPGPHLGVLGRVEVVLVGRAPGDRVEPDVGRALALELPDVTAAVGLDDVRDAVRVLRRPVLGEHAAGLDDVVVDADQDEVLGVHGCLLLHAFWVGAISTYVASASASTVVSSSAVVITAWTWKRRPVVSPACAAHQLGVDRCRAAVAEGHLGGETHRVPAVLHEAHHLVGEGREQAPVHEAGRAFCVGTEPDMTNGSVRRRPERDPQRRGVGRAAAEAALHVLQRRHRVTLPQVDELVKYWGDWRA